MDMALNKLQHKGHAWIMLIGLLLVMALMYSLRRCRYAGESERLHPSGGDTIDVAIEYSPMSLYRYDDTLGGFNYDMIRLLAEKHGFTVKFHPVVKLAKSLEHIEDKTYDILVADIPLTAEFKDRYDFLEPVLLDRQVLVQMKDSTGQPQIKNRLDLAGDTVWVVEGSSIVGRINNLAHEIGDTIYINYEPEYGAEQLFIMTATGEIKQAVINERIAKSLSADYPDADISTNISFTQFQSWIAGKKRPEFTDSLNRWIIEFKGTPEYRNLEKRYLR